MKLGWMENFMGGYGSKDRYELANTLNRFSRQLPIDYYRKPE